MNSIVVYQLDAAGFCLCQTTADESPREPGVFLIPYGCVEAAPPAAPEGKRAQHVDGAWTLVDIPVPEPEVPEEEDLPPPPTLEEVKEKVRDAIWWERIRRTQTGGFLVGGKWFHSDTFSRTQQRDLRDLGEDLPAGLDWTTMDGSEVRLTPALVKQVCQAALVSDIAIFAVAKAHRLAMEASEDPAAYDFSRDWPLGYGEEPQE